MKLDLEQQGYNIAYKEKFRLYNEGEKQHEENMVKAFATIMNNYCSKVMKHRVEEKSDYESAVRDNPVELLIRIKQYMYVPTRAKYKYEGFLETLK